MHGLMRFFRLFYKINIRLNKSPIPIEKPLRGGLPAASIEQWLDNQGVMQKFHMSHIIYPFI